ncbi:MAG: SLC13/DASS family transporter [Bacteroidales bacterium]|nr:SLC13/DASS family transporter [Bacteroidales bacterium]
MSYFSFLGHPMNLKRCLSFLVVCIFTFFLALVPTSFFGVNPETGLPIFTLTQQRVIAIFVFTAMMWILEVIPTWTTSVVAIVSILLTTSNKGLGFLIVKENVGALTNYKDIMAAFADPVIMLFLGGFVLAFAATKVGLDVQLAKVMLKPFGTNPKTVLLGVLLVIGIFSMFMSNTATAAMMLTFLTPVLATLPKDGGGRISLALAIPIAANIGGMGTPIGTPPNAIALGALQEAGYAVTFAGWMLRMVPYVILMLVIAWVLLMKLYPFKAKSIELKIEGQEVKATPFQKYVVWVTFALTIILWVGEQWFKINSNIVAMIPFAVFSATGIMKAKHLEHINWAVLWMVAGGFALGTALNQTGLASTLIKTIPFASWNALVVMLVGGFICYFLSNFISNSASANLVVPILIVVGKAMAGNPESAESFNALGGVPAMIIGVAICASLAMCLPVSTPPNALAHSTGMITTKQMATVGIVMGAVGLVLGYLMLIFIGF